MDPGNPILGWGGLLVAVYGAVLSTILAVLHWKRDQGKFVLNPVTLHIESFGGKTVWRTVEVVNVGRRAIYLDDFGFTLKSGENVSLRDKHTDFPFKLDEGQSMVP